MHEDVKAASAEAELEDVRARYLNLSEQHKRRLLAYVARNDDKAFDLWLTRVQKRSRIKGVHRGNVLARVAPYGAHLDAALFERGPGLPIRIFKCRFGYGDYEPNATFLRMMEERGNERNGSDPELVRSALEEIAAQTDDEEFDLYCAALRLVEPLWFKGASTETRALLSPDNTVDQAGVPPNATVKASAPAEPDQMAQPDALAQPDTVAPPDDVDTDSLAVPEGTGPNDESAAVGQTNAEFEAAASLLLEAVELGAEDLAKAHDILKHCASEYERWTREAHDQYASGSADAYRSATEAIANLLPQRQEAARKVSATCEVLGPQIDAVAALLEGAPGNSALGTVLSQIAESVQAARISYDSSIADGLRNGAGTIRERLRSLREGQLAGLSQEVSALAAKLESLDQDASESRHLIQDRVYLDRPIDEGRRRLENEAAILRRRIEEADANRASRSLEVLAEMLDSKKVSDFGHAIALLRSGQTAGEARRLRSLGLGLMQQNREAEGPFADRLSVWQDLVSIITANGADALSPDECALSLPAGMLERVEDLVAVLPGAIEAVGIAQEGDAPWGLAEAFWAAGSLAWARAAGQVAWDRTRSRPALARWLQKSGLPPTRQQLSALVEALGAAECIALRSLAAARGLESENHSETLLIAAWIDREEPYPDIHCLEVAANGYLESNLPGAVVLCSVAVRSGLEGLISNRWLDVIRTAGCGHVSAVFTAYQRIGREELSRRVAQLTESRNAGEELVRLTRDRNPKSATAYEVWKRDLEPLLGRFRARLVDSATRPEALSELQDLDAEKVTRNAANRRAPGLNRRALDTLCEWVEAHKARLPVATVRPELPLEFYEERVRGALRGEADILVQSGPLGVVARTLLAVILKHPFPPAQPGSNVEFEDCRRTVFEHLLSMDADPLVYWRFMTSDGPGWLEATGEDVLERIADGSGWRLAALGYIRGRRYGLAERLLAATPAGEKPVIEEIVRPKIEDVRKDQRGLIEALAIAPLEAASAGWGVDAKPELRFDIERLQEGARLLLAKLGSQDVDAVERELAGLLDQIAIVTEDCAAAERAERDLVANRIFRAAEQFRCGNPISQPVLVTRLILAASSGHRTEATRLATVPPESHDYSREEPRSEPEGDALTAPVATRSHPCMEVSVSQLSVLTKGAWDLTTVPDGFQVNGTPGDVAASSSTDRFDSLLRSAKKLHGTGDGRWRNWLACWAVEMGKRRAKDSSFVNTAMLSRDALVLLAPTGSDDELLRDQALLLWLASRIETTNLSLARQAPDWDVLLRSAGVRVLGQIVRRFFELGAGDLLAESLADLAEVGGAPLPRVLSTLAGKEFHLRAQLVRDLVRFAPEGGGGNLRVTVDLLMPWLAPEAIESVERNLAAAMAGGGDSSAPTAVARQALVDAAVPQEILERLEDGLRRRAEGDASQSETGQAHRLTGRVLSKSIYASATETEAGGEIVVEIGRRGGKGTLRGLRAALTLEHPSLAIEAENRVRDLGVLRPDETKELTFKFVVASPGISAAPSAKATATVLVYGSEDAPLLQRRFVINVGKEYPYRHALSPYVYGKCLTSLDLIKGRERETTEILDTLRGQHDDNFVVIYGMRRIGKSSLLQKLSLDVRARRRYVPVHLDLEHYLKSKDTSVTFLEKLAEGIQRDIPDRRAKEVRPPAGATDARIFPEFEKYLRAVADRLAPEKRLLLLFDEFQMLFTRSMAEQMQDVIKSLRHWIQFLPISFVAAGTPELQDATIGPEQRLFQLGVPIKVGPLDEIAARDLIREPVAQTFYVTPRAVDAIVNDCKGLPNLIQAVCVGLFNNVKASEKTVATFDDAERALDQVSSAAEYFSFLIAPLERKSMQKMVMRALAAITQDEARGTPEGILDHLRIHGRGDEIDQASLEMVLKELKDLGIAFHWQKGEWRLQPPILARHVMQRAEFAL